MEVSNDLVNFRSANAGEFTETILTSDATAQTVKITDTIAVGAQPRRYVRLRITTLP